MGAPGLHTPVAHQVYLTDPLNGLLVISGTVLIFLHLFLRPKGAYPFAKPLTWPLLICSILVVLENRGVHPAGVNTEPAGFLILLGGLGLTAARHTLASERKLIEVEQELATARRIQNSTIPPISAEPAESSHRDTLPADGVGGG